MTERHEPGQYSAGSLLSYQRDEPVANLTEMEFRVLRDGDINDEKASRNLCVGLFVSGLIGVIGLIETVDWDTAIRQSHKGPFVYALVLATVTLSSAVMTVICHRRCNRTNTSAYSELMKRFDDFFEKHRKIDTTSTEDRSANGR